MTDPAAILNFVTWFGASVILLLAFLAAHTLLTHFHEWQLIRQGNSAVALALGGSMIGFALPLASSIYISQTLPDMIITAAIALVVQLACFAAMRLLRRDAREALAKGDMAEAILLASTSLVMGLLSAACLT
jgi:putative membrane protein